MTEPELSRETYSSPWRPARWGAAAVLGCVLLLTVWSVTAPISGAAIASGNLQVQGGRQTVQHPYGGVIFMLNVRDGDTVARGDVLLSLSPTEPQAELDVLRSRWNAALAQRARLQAEREEGDLSDFLDEEFSGNPQMIANERALMFSRTRQHEAGLSLIAQRITQLEQRATGIGAQISGLERQLELSEEEFSTTEQLVASGTAPRARLLDLQSGLTGIQSDLGLRRSELSGVEESKGEARLEIAQLEQTRLSEITQSLARVDTELADLAPRLEAAKDVLDRTQILAPASGRVVGLSVFTEGGVIQPGAQLMEIVPGDSPLFVEARLNLTDISAVANGQSADVRLIGTPQTMRPELSGRVTNISADSLADERSGEQYYQLQVGLDAAEVAGAAINLQPGMPVQVVIETTPRTLVGYLAGPLLDEISGAFRER